MIATLLIETALRADKTILKECFYTPPFKVLDITEDKCETTLHLMLMSASPGVLDGDAYRMEIRMAKSCSLQLHTQSYQRLFRMKGGATQALEIHMEAGSSFCYVPHPVVPHAFSNFSAKTKIFLSQGCTLVWGDVLTCGRKGCGEQFAFSKYHSCIEIFSNMRLVIKENLMLQPSATDIAALGQLENHTHQASFIYLNEEAPVQSIADKLHALLSLETNICFGITTLPVNGFMVRLLGYKAEQLYGLLKKLAAELTTGTAYANQQATIENRNDAN